MAKRILVAGGGFAGLWSAAAAARLRALKGFGADDLEIALVAPDAFHTIRVRCYEEDLSDIRVPLDAVLGPIGARRIEARVAAIDPVRRVARLGGEANEELAYDRLVLATGSALVRPGGIAGRDAFDVDTYAGGARLAEHLAGLGASAPPEGRWSAVVLGGGLVGIELACELPGRMRAARASAASEGDAPVRVVLVDRAGEIGAAMGAAGPAIRQALTGAGVELRPGRSLLAYDGARASLDDGETIPCATLVLATGMRASPLAGDLPVARDALGRVPVDRFLRVEGVDAVYAAGDVARAPADEAGHATVMSCQHARPMGRLAGHNAACDLLLCPEERVPFAAPDYVTVLDLGDAGAAYTRGWDRDVLLAEGAAAKATKRTINRERIYPPRGGDAAAIFAAADPIIQAAPSVRMERGRSEDRAAAQGST